MDIVFRPIGAVRNPLPDQRVKKREGGEATVEIFQEFGEGLEGLEGFSHAFVLTFFHRLRPEQVGPLRVKPRRMLDRGLRPDELPTRGVFALDSPTRPNPIGLSLVRLEGVEGRMLRVSGLDVFDGTPVLDVKPYQSRYRAEGYTLPEWYRRLHDAGHA
ncbi:MAG: tRNA (N6-threonylcarbamoyladenosine(37)-N6)-methyltransferase TrmO [Nitrososphaerota archaeon]|nr:tRNA (N6-threonylcarbamoyladenosine(37)-N6)-methyltransferase TrmO [Nitrososphaerota archaeon]MDG6940069.1 tRNA (N6-threonylcarbamoyladenosine(37)-N6)-methyltransferase TrmO [Nitrososphaerota archaeon]